MKRLFDLSCSLFVDAFVFARNLFANHPVPFAILAITLLVVSIVSTDGVVSVLSRYVFVMVSYYLVFFFSWVILDTVVWRLFSSSLMSTAKEQHVFVKATLRDVASDEKKHAGYKKKMEDVMHRLRRIDSDRAVLSFLFLIIFSLVALVSLANFFLYLVVVFCVFVYLVYRARQDAGWIRIAYKEAVQTIYLWHKHRRKECHEYFVHSNDMKVKNFLLLYIEVVERMKRQ